MMGEPARVSQRIIKWGSAMTRRTQREAGVSFIDVMLALVVLTIGVLALADLQTAASNGSIASKRIMSAMTVAEQKLEAIKNTPYANIVAEPATPVTAADGLTYTRQVSVVNDSPLVNTKTVTVTVTWSAGSQMHTVPTTTIIGQ